MDNQAQLSPPQDYNVQQPVSVDTGQASVPMMDDVLNSRTNKANIGLGSISGKSVDDIREALQKGKEKDFRTEAASKVTALDYQQRQEHLFQALNTGVSPDSLNQLIRKYSLEQADPDTVIEKGYAGAYFKSVADMTNPFARYSDLGEADKDSSEAVKMLHRTGEGIAASREYFNTRLEDTQNAINAQSTGGAILDDLKSMVPGYDEIKLRHGWPTSFLGSDMQKQADEILSLPLPEAKSKLESFLPKLIEDNPQEAYRFMTYLTGKSIETETMDNIYSAMNIANVLDIAKGSVKLLGRSLGLIKRASEVSKDAVKAIDLVPQVTPETAVAVGKGDLKEAAIQQAAERFVADTRGTINPLQRAIESMPTFFRRDIKALKADAGNYGTDKINRMEEKSDALQQDLKKDVLDSARTNRVPELTGAKLHYEKISNDIENAYPNLANNLMNIKGPVWDPVGASWFAGRILGRNKGTYFGSMGEARNWAKANDIALSAAVKKTPTKKVGKYTTYGPAETHYLYGAEIKPIGELGKQGNGWYITDLVPIDETSPSMRSLLGETARSRPPQDWTGGWMNGWIGWLVRSPDETQSLDQQIARKISTFAPSNYLDMVRQHTRDLRRLAPSSSWYGFTHRKQWKDFNDVLRYAQDKEIFFDGPGQLAEHYNTFYQRLPHDREVEAYFEFKRLVEADRYMRTMAVVRNKQRVGVQEHHIIMEGKDGPVRIPPVEGMKIDHFPQGDHTIMFFKRDPNHTRLYSGNGTPEAFRKEIEEDMKAGRGQMFKVYNTEERPFADFQGRVRGRLGKDISAGTSKVEYFFARRAETRPLDLSKQINRKYGGHLVPDYDFSIAQPKVVWDNVTKTWHYEGDNHAFFVRNRALGSEFAKRMNENRALLREGKEEEAIAHAREHLHIPAEDFHKDFKPSYGPNGEKNPPRWSLDHRLDFQVKPTGRNIIDLGKEALESKFTNLAKGVKFRNGTISGNPARQSVVEFTQQRDAYEMQEVQNKGTRSNPVYNLEPANLIDPIPMMARGLNRIMHSLNMDDYKIQAMEHWLFGKNIRDPTTGEMVGAANFMKDPMDLIKYSPFHYWNNIEWKAGFKGSTEWALLTGDKAKIDMFIGVPNMYDRILREASQKLADSIYTHLGPKAERFVPSWMISKISDGPQAVRNILYDLKMGFFSPRQFFLHSVTTLNAFLISPQSAPHGALGALFHGMTAMNANTVDHLDMLASKFGLFKPGDFKAFRQGLLNSGFIRVERGQHAFVDTPMSAQVIRSGGSAFLQAGTSPFRAGVSTVKTAAWYMAANEWRQGKLGRSLSGSRWSAVEGPARVGAPNRDDFGLILNRADDLAHNMSRASSSAIQKGFTSFGSQFTSFNQRVIELLAGKRLTVPEKLRLFLGYGAFYGAPAAGGIFGLSAMIRSIMQGTDPMTGKPYVPGENLTSTIMMEGMVATALYEATGHLLNIGEAYGAKDLDFVDSAINGASFLYTLGGASLHGLVNFGASLTPFITWGQTLLNNDDPKFQLTPQHFIDLFKEISVVNYADRAYLGYVTHKWMSRNGSYLADTTATAAILMNIFGVQDQETADVYNKSKEIESWRQSERRWTGYIAKEIQMEFTAAAQQNWNEAEKHHMNAKVYLQGIPENKWPTLIKRLEQDAFRPLKDKINEEYLIGRDRPDKLRKQGQAGWQDLLERNK